MSRHASTKLYETVAKINDAKPKMVFQQALKITDDVFRVVVSHGTTKYALNEDNYSDLITEATDSKFRLVAESIEPLGLQRQNVVFSALIEANVEVRDYDEAEIRKGYTCLSANLFRDRDDDTVWKVVETGNGSRNLVQSVKEEYADLLASILARKNETLSSARYSGIVPGNGDYVQYYDANNNTMRFGFAMLSSDIVQVFDRKLKTVVDVFPAQIVAAVDGDSLDEKFSLSRKLRNDAREAVMSVNAASNDTASINAYLDYMKILYGDTDYFRALEKAVRSGRNASPLMPSLSA